jgi:capsular polysaccharide transport system permease protein
VDSPRIGSEVDKDYLGLSEGEVVNAASAPQKMVAKLKSWGFLFWITVVFPTIMAILYFGLFASDVYVSESRFVVRSPDKPAATGLGVLLKSTGFNSGGDEIFAAKDYVASRDALAALNHNDAFKAAYSADNISIFDRFNPLGMNGTVENLYKYYQKKVNVDHDTTTSITTLTVRAFSPQDARRFNGQLLELAERTVNKLNARGRRDLVQLAEAEVEGAKEKAQVAASALAKYRNREGVVDPEMQATVQLQMISKIQDELIATKTQLSELRKFTPQNPQIEVLDTRMRGLSREIDEQLGKVAGDRKSLSSTAELYQRLALESQFADKQLASAMASLEDARNEALRKQAYVERIVQPNLPDEALEPRRLRGIFATFILGLVVWGLASMLLSGVKEHNI